MQGRGKNNESHLANLRDPEGGGEAGPEVSFLHSQERGNEEGVEWSGMVGGRIVERW